MSDWPRYPIPHVPGWNNTDGGPTFSFAYDDGNDVLTITASEDVMSGAESLRLVVDAANYDIGLPTFVVDSGTQITIPDASAIAEGELTQIDVYEDDNTTVLIGVATGNATLAAPVVSFVENYSYADFYQDGLFSSPPDCAGIATAAPAVPSMFLYGTFGPDVDGFRFATTDGDKDYRLSVDPSYIGGGAIDPGYALVSDASLASSSITSIVPLDIAGNPIGSPTNFTDLNYLGTVVGDDSVAGEMTWTFASDSAIVPTRVDLNYCPNNARTYYDPTGPNSGLNPGTATIVTWDATTIVIQDTFFDGTFDVIRVEMRGDEGGRIYGEWANPLYEL